MEPIGQLDDHNPDVLGHGHEHLPDVLCLLLLHGPSGAELAELGDAVDEASHFAAETLLDVREGHVGVLGDVVEQGSREGLCVHLQLRQVVGDLERVGDVRLAGGPQLPFVGGGRDLMGALDQADVDARPMASRFGDDVSDGGRFGRGLWRARDALHHGGRSRTQACEVHGAEILHAGTSVPGMGVPVWPPSDGPCSALQLAADRTLAFVDRDPVNPESRFSSLRIGTGAGGC